MNLTKSLTGAALLALAATMQAQEPAAKASAADKPVEKAIAVLHPTKDSETTGTIVFEKSGDSVRVTGEVRGLTPGKHGFHIHEFGDCSAPDATSAGGHFNPTDVPHGAPKGDKHHIGDLGNIEADDSGVAKVDVKADFLKFEGPTSILGRGLIVHAGEDDLKTQPTGDAGGRVACGVIGVANMK